METSSPPDVPLILEPNWKGLSVISIYPSPANLLASTFLNQMTPGVWIVSGPRGIGKTTWCTKVTEKAQSAGLSVAGILCPGEFEHGKKTAIHLTDISTREQRQLGKHVAYCKDGIRVGNWLIDERAIAWGNQILSDAIGKELLIIDELGILEFERSGGFQEGMRILDNGCYKLALVVIRPELIEVALARWPGAEIIYIGEKAV